MKSSIFLGLLALYTPYTLAIDCGAITCGSTICETVCDGTPGCEWNINGRSTDTNQACWGEGTIWDTTCCISSTTTTTPEPTTSTTTPAPTTSEPTPAPTCPDLSGASDPCSGLDQECCVASTACTYSTSKFCQNEGGSECCTLVTDEPTTSTTSESSEEPTSTPEPTTKNSWPTKRPTMHSAQKWTMIHPAYKGNDGELLWHVYYGDFSDDEQFDEFRDKQLWDAQVLRPIIETDGVFRKYQQSEKGEAVLADSSNSLSNSSSSMFSGVDDRLVLGMMMMIGLALIGGFAHWNKYKGSETTFCCPSEYELVQ